MTPAEQLMAAVEHREQSSVPVVLWDNAPPVTRLYKVPESQYHHDAAVKLRTQLQAITEFPEAMWLPGIFADFGTVVEGAMLGCRVIWFEDDAPHAAPALDSIQAVRRLRPQNVRQEGLTATVLDQLRFFWRDLDPRLIEQYGYLDGVAFSMGPIEVAAQVRGYGEFLTDLYDHPGLVHELLRLTTESVIEWIRAQEEVNGRLKRLIMPEHFPSNLSPAHFEEFCFPYLKQVYDAFAYAPFRMYHNEGNTQHMFHRIPAFGANVFHCGLVDLRDAKTRIGAEVCLMGNVSATTVLYSGNADEVTRACRECLAIGAPGGGYLLSCGGAFAPGTPRENLRAMIAAGVAWREES
jgi:uroporphyrinogen decarboxylase